MAEFAVCSPSELQRACDLVREGDTILVHGGLYTEPSKLRKKGTLSQPIVIRAADRDWIRGWRDPDPDWGDKPRWDTEVIITGVALAFHDAQTTGKLHPMTRKALDRMWALPMKSGTWNWIKCNWPPMEHDDYFGAVFAAVGLGAAPEGYTAGESARAGLEKLTGYLKKTPAPSLHHRAWLLWASVGLEGLLSKQERQKTGRPCDG